MSQETAKSQQNVDWISMILHLLHKANPEQLRAIYYLILGYLGI